LPVSFKRLSADYVIGHSIAMARILGPILKSGCGPFVGAAAASENRRSGL